MGSGDDRLSHLHLHLEGSMDCVIYKTKLESMTSKSSKNEGRRSARAMRGLCSLTERSVRFYECNTKYRTLAIGR